MRSEDVLASAECPLGIICLWQRDLPELPGVKVIELTLDHMLLMSSEFTNSERALAREALVLHEGDGLSVLVGGLGLGYTAGEVLASSRVAELEVVELLAPVIEWFEQGIMPLAAELGADARMKVREADVYAYLTDAPRRQYDIILIDVDHSPEERLGDESATFYSEESLRKVREHLAPGGLFGLWSYAESPAFEVALAAAFGEVRVERITAMNRVTGDEETNRIFLARC
jgi:spermidine synthase